MGVVPVVAGWGGDAARRFFAGVAAHAVAALVGGTDGKRVDWAWLRPAAVRVGLEAGAGGLARARARKGVLTRPVAGETLREGVGSILSKSAGRALLAVPCDVVEVLSGRARVARNHPGLGVLAVVTGQAVVSSGGIVIDDA